MQAANGANIHFIAVTTGVTERQTFIENGQSPQLIFDRITDISKVL